MARRHFVPAGWVGRQSKLKISELLVLSSKLKISELLVLSPLVQSSGDGNPCR